MIKCFLVLLSLVVFTSCSKKVEDLPSVPSTDFIRQYDLLPSSVQFVRPGNPCVSATLHNEAIYYTEDYSKFSIADDNSTTDTFDRILMVYSDSGCNSYLYSIAYLRDIVSTSQSSATTDTSRTTLAAVQMNVQDTPYKDALNTANFLGVTWVVNNLEDIQDLHDSVSNSVLYPTGTISDFTIRTNAASKTVFINGVEYRWP